MSLAPYRLGLTATPKRSDGREADLDTLIGPVVYQRAPSELSGDTLADYQDVKILVRLSATEQARYDELIRSRNDFLWRMHIKLGSPRRLAEVHQRQRHPGRPQSDAGPP